MYSQHLFVLPGVSWPLRKFSILQDLFLAVLADVYIESAKATRALDAAKDKRHFTNDCHVAVILTCLLEEAWIWNIHYCDIHIALDETLPVTGVIQRTHCHLFRGWWSLTTLRAWPFIILLKWGPACQGLIRTLSWPCDPGPGARWIVGCSP